MEQYVFAFFVPVAAVVLDSYLGDPRSFPHPVRYIGMVLDWYEASARKVGLNLRFAGWFAVLFLAAATWSLSAFLLAIPVLGLLVAIYLGYAGLALGCLIKESRRVASRLDVGDLEGARSALSGLVSRDTENLDANGIRRTLAETVSENFNDGFVAPLFYLALLGPGGMWAYKVVSTMDSMWGYRTQRFRELGHGAAKMDDWLAYIPARIAARALLWAGRRHGCDANSAKRFFRDDAVKMDSPNAGWPMAAAAWLLGGQMGGLASYFGQERDKPVLGPSGAIWTKDMIRDLLSLCRKAGILATWMLVPLLGCLQLFLIH